MSNAEKRALELYPPKYIRETWKRTEPDVNAPLRDAYVKGWNAGYLAHFRMTFSSHINNPNLNNSKL